MDQAELEAVKRAVTEGIEQARVKFVSDADIEAHARTYQHATEWVRMCNSITWTVASVYLVSAVLAMNTAVSRPAGSHERTVIGVIWILLLVVWLLVDFVYLRSAAHARNEIEKLETKDTFRGVHFYTEQRTSRWFKGLALPLLLLLSGAIVGYLWYEITWVWADPPPGKIQLLNPPA